MKLVRLNLSGLMPIALRLSKVQTLEQILLSLGYPPDTYIPRIDGRFVPTDYVPDDDQTVDILLTRDDPAPITRITKAEIEVLQSAEPEHHLRTDHSCDFCGGKAVHVERYALNMLRDARVYRCADCLIHEVKRKCFGTLDWFQLVRPGDTVLIPLSAGKDSATELSMVSEYIRSRDIPAKLVAYTVQMSRRNLFFKQTVARAIDLAARFNAHHIVIDLKEYYGAYLDEIVDRRIRSEGIPYWGPCVLCSAIRAVLQNALITSLRATTVTSGCTLIDGARHLFWGLFYSSSWRRFARPFVEEPSGIKCIHPLYELSEVETSLYTHLLDLPVVRHYETECPFAGTGTRSAQTDILHRINNYMPGLLHQSTERLLKGLEYLDPKRDRTGRCISCGSTYYRILESGKCVICEVHHAYGLDVPEVRI